MSNTELPDRFKVVGTVIEDTYPGGHLYTLSDITVLVNEFQRQINALCSTGRALLDELDDTEYTRAQQRLASTIANSSEIRPHIYEHFGVTP